MFMVLEFAVYVHDGITFFACHIGVYLGVASFISTCLSLKKNLIIMSNFNSHLTMIQSHVHPHLRKTKCINIPYSRGYCQNYNVCHSLVRDNIQPGNMNYSHPINICHHTI